MNRTRTHRSRNRRRGVGFTMIEVMVALLLTAIAASGIIALFMVQTRSSGYSRHVTEATVLAQDEMERLRAMDAAYLSAGSGSVSNINELGQSGGIFTRSWAIAASAGTHVDVTVTVSWNEDGTSRAVTLVSRTNE